MTCIFEDVDGQMCFHNKFFEEHVTSHATNKVRIANKKPRGLDALLGRLPDRNKLC